MARVDDILQRALRAAEPYAIHSDERGFLAGVIHELVGRVTELESALRDAVAFVEASPCDPDITAEQWALYPAYCWAREIVQAAAITENPHSSDSIFSPPEPLK